MGLCIHTSWGEKLRAGNKALSKYRPTTVIAHFEPAEQRPSTKTALSCQEVYPGKPFPCITFSTHFNASLTDQVPVFLSLLPGQKQNRPVTVHPLSKVSSFCLCVPGHENPLSWCSLAEEHARKTRITVRWHIAKCASNQPSSSHISSASASTAQIYRNEQ